ncbi:hypothetical protein DID75_02020 [Candidatus Marinamargulisbacteria bacterium SCGC AG-410-N11]|nr:hypothetical protein DID75_02020 [Candidatus Marinamargulisbacteria bacterium SCGC AG-410-N11]
MKKLVSQVITNIKSTSNSFGYKSPTLKKRVPKRELLRINQLLKESINSVSLQTFLIELTKKINKTLLKELCHYIEELNTLAKTDTASHQHPKELFKSICVNYNLYGSSVHQTKSNQDIDLLGFLEVTYKKEPTSAINYYIYFEFLFNYIQREISQQFNISATHSKTILKLWDPKNYEAFNQIALSKNIDLRHVIQFKSQSNSTLLFGEKPPYDIISNSVIVNLDLTTNKHQYQSFFYDQIELSLFLKKQNIITSPHPEQLNGSLLSRLLKLTKTSNINFINERLIYVCVKSLIKELSKPLSPYERKSFTSKLQKLGTQIQNVITLIPELDQQSDDYSKTKLKLFILYKVVKQLPDNGFLLKMLASKIKTKTKQLSSPKQIDNILYYNLKNSFNIQNIYHYLLSCLKIISPDTPHLPYLINYLNKELHYHNQQKQGINHILTNYLQQTPNNNWQKQLSMEELFIVLIEQLIFKRTILIPTINHQSIELDININPIKQQLKKIDTMLTLIQKFNLKNKSLDPYIVAMKEQQQDLTTFFNLYQKKQKDYRQYLHIKSEYQDFNFKERKDKIATSLKTLEKFIKRYEHDIINAITRLDLVSQNIEHQLVMSTTTIETCIYVHTQKQKLLKSFKLLPLNIDLIKILNSIDTPYSEQQIVDTVYERLQQQVQQPISLKALSTIELLMQHIINNPLLFNDNSIVKMIYDQLFQDYQHRATHIITYYVNQFIAPTQDTVNLDYCHKLEAIFNLSRVPLPNKINCLISIVNKPNFISKQNKKYYQALKKYLKEPSYEFGIEGIPIFINGLYNLLNYKVNHLLTRFNGPQDLLLACLIKNIVKENFQEFDSLFYFSTVNILINKNKTICDALTIQFITILFNIHQTKNHLDTITVLKKLSQKSSYPVLTSVIQYFNNQVSASVLPLPNFSKDYVTTSLSTTKQQFYINTLLSIRSNQNNLDYDSEIELLNHLLQIKKLNDQIVIIHQKVIISLLTTILNKINTGIILHKNLTLNLNIINDELNKMIIFNSISSQRNHERYFKEQLTLFNIQLDDPLHEQIKIINCLYYVFMPYKIYSPLKYYPIIETLFSKPAMIASMQTKYESILIFILTNLIVKEIKYINIKSITDPKIFNTYMALNHGSLKHLLNKQSISTVLSHLSPYLLDEFRNYLPYLIFQYSNPNLKLKFKKLAKKSKLISISNFRFKKTNNSFILLFLTNRLLALKQLPYCSFANKLFASECTVELKIKALEHLALENIDQLQSKPNLFINQPTQDELATYIGDNINFAGLKMLITLLFKQELEKSHYQLTSFQINQCKPILSFNEQLSVEERIEFGSSLFSYFLLLVDQLSIDNPSQFIKELYKIFQQPTCANDIQLIYQIYLISFCHRLKSKLDESKYAMINNLMVKAISERLITYYQLPNVKEIPLTQLQNILFPIINSSMDLTILINYIDKAITPENSIHLYKLKIKMFICTYPKLQKYLPLKEYLLKFNNISILLEAMQYFCYINRKDFVINTLRVILKTIRISHDWVAKLCQLLHHYDFDSQFNDIVNHIHVKQAPLWNNEIGLMYIENEQYEQSLPFIIKAYEATKVEPVKNSLILNYNNLLHLDLSKSHGYITKIKDLSPTDQVWDNIISQIHRYLNVVKNKQSIEQYQTVLNTIYDVYPNPKVWTLIIYSYLLNNKPLTNIVNNSNSPHNKILSFLNDVSSTINESDLTFESINNLILDFHSVEVWQQLFKQIEQKVTNRNILQFVMAINFIINKQNEDSIKILLSLNTIEPSPILDHYLLENYHKQQNIFKMEEYIKRLTPDVVQLLHPSNQLSFQYIKQQLEAIKKAEKK